MFTSALNLFTQKGRRFSPEGSKFMPEENWLPPEVNKFQKEGSGFPLEGNPLPFLVHRPARGQILPPSVQLDVGRMALARSAVQYEVPTNHQPQRSCTCTSVMKSPPACSSRDS